MSNCNHCGNCSWPDLVANARANLPDPWRAELLKIEREDQSVVPDAIWVAAMLKFESGDMDGSVLDAIIDNVDGPDLSWADSVLRRSHS